MPMTAADWAALAQAGQQGGTAYLEGLNAQQQAELQPVAGSVGSGSTPGAPATSDQFTVGQDAIAAVQQAYPDLAWLLSVPSVGPLIVQAAQSGESEANFQAQFESSAWYKTNAQSVRNWIAEVETDPAQATSDLQAQMSSMNVTLQNLGLNATAAQLQEISTQSLVFGWTAQQIKDNISASITSNPNGTFSFDYGGQTSGPSAGGGTLTANVDSIQAEAAKYLVPISGTTASAFANAMAQGTMDSTAVDAYFQTQAASLYPSIAAAIKNGITPADYVTPYKEVAAQLLGVDPNSIDMTQAKWNRPLSAPGPGGVPTAMSLYDWQQTLMQDPQYGYNNSVNAKDRASSIAQGLAEMFGKAPSGPAGSTAFQNAGAPRMAGVPIT